MNRPALGRLSATNALIIINVLVYLWLCIAHIGHHALAQPHHIIKPNG